MTNTKTPAVETTRKLLRSDFEGLGWVTSAESQEEAKFLAEYAPFIEALLANPGWRVLSRRQWWAECRLPERTPELDAAMALIENAKVTLPPMPVCFHEHIAAFIREWAFQFRMRADGEFRAPPLTSLKHLVLKEIPEGAEAEYSEVDGAESVNWNYPSMFRV